MELLASHTWCLLLLGLVFAILWKCRLWLRRALLVSRLPGPPASPIIGNILQIRNTKCLTELAIDLYNQNIPLVRVWVSFIPVVIIFSAEHLKVLLSSKEEIHKSTMYNVLKEFLGTALITGSGEYWQRHRKMINPTFHMSVIENFLPIFVRNSKRMADSMKKHAESGEAIDIGQFSFSCTLDIICETAMGTPVNAQETHLFHDFSSATMAALDIMMNHILKPWLFVGSYFNIITGTKAIRKHYRHVEELSEKVIQVRRNANKLQHNNNIESDIGEKRKSVFLDFLIKLQEDGVGLSDTELMHEVNTFITAGHETASQTASFCLFMIGLHPEVQKKVQNELNDIFGDSDRDATLEDFRNMKYLERCILETLRLFPSAPAIGRKLANDLQLGDHIVPAGCEVMIPIMFIHRQKQHYPNPHRFNPDNFLQENIRKRHPYAYLAFSAGPRSCIGQKFAMLELKALISTVLRMYYIEAATKLSLRNLRWKITLKTRDPLLIKLHAKKNH